MKKYKADNNNVLGVLTGKETDDEIASSIESKFSWHRDEITTTRRQWMINAAFARGQQYSVLHRTEDKLLNLQPPGKRKQVTADKISPWKKRRIADLVTVTPIFKAQPKNLDPNSISAARAGTALLMYYWNTWRYMELYVKQMGYNVDFGNHFIYLNYVEDGTKLVVKEIRDSYTGDILRDENDESIVETYPVGDIVPSLLSPDRVACPIDDTPMREKPWVIISQKQPLEYFKEKYVNGDKVLPENKSSINSYGLDRINSDYETNPSGLLEYANELIYLQRPSLTNKDGIVTTSASGVLLKSAGEKAVHPWPYNKLLTNPVIHFHGLQESGEFYARSDIEMQIPLQNAINMLWSILLENADNMVNTKWMIHRTADVTEISDINEMIEWSGDFEPHQSEIRSIPEYVFASIDRLERSIQDVQSSHGASQGGAVSGVRSDVHAQNLQDQDMLPLLIQDNLNKIAFEEMGEIILTIAAEKMDKERIISYIGADKRYVVEKFIGSMLGDTRQVEVTMENILMRSKGMVRQMALEMFQIGGITDQFGRPDPMKLQRILEFSLPSSVNKEMECHTELAYREMDRILEGSPVFVLPQQNHMIHFQIHTEFMNTSDFMLLHEEETPQNVEIRERFYQHLQEHDQMQKQALGMIQQRQPAGASRPKEEAQRPQQRKESE